MLATLSGALLLALAFAAAVMLAAESAARFGGGASLFGPDLFDAGTRYLGLAFAAAALPALPAALAAPFARIGEPPLRSALALNPGALFAVVVWLAALVASLAMSPMAEVGIRIAFQRSAGSFENFVFLALPLAIALGAAFGGARTSDSTAAAAAPVVLVVTCGLAAELSIGTVFLSVLLPLIAAAAAIAILYAFAPAAAVTPWLSGIALAVGATLLIAPGLVTPTEALALIALFGLPAALIVRALALKQPLGAMLRQMASETVAVVAALAAGSLGILTLLQAGVSPTLGVEAAPSAALAAGGVAFLAACCLLSPVLVAALALPFVLATLKTTGIEPVPATSIMVLLALAAVVARAGRRGATAASPALRLPAALLAAGGIAALAILVAFAPGIALAPTAIMR
ncbi:MAG: hypothetical protein U1F37_10110 [Alphaproteobacteria bacterium]